jgi:hypothetical protein
MIKKQDAITGHGGLVNQAMGDIHIGLQATDVIALVDDRVKQILAVHTPVAEAEGNRRIAELTMETFNRIGDDPGRLETLSDPGFSLAFRDAQRSYAASGSSELREILSTILAEGTRPGTHDLEMILLREAIAVAPKLTSEHIAILALIFLCTNPMPEDGPDRTVQAIAAWLDRSVAPYFRGLPNSDMIKQHLIYCGCVERNGGYRSIDDYFAQEYQNSFRKPLTTDDARTLDMLGVYQPLTGRESADVAGDQFFLPLSLSEFDTLLSNIPLSPNERKIVGTILSAYGPGPEDVHEVMKERSVFWTELNVWQASHRDLVLTGAGMTIAHSSLTAKGVPVPPLMECISRIPY